MPRPARRLPAVTALGAQTAPQLKINIMGGLNAGLSKVEVSEIIGQMALYVGFPALTASVSELTTRYRGMRLLDIFNEDSEVGIQAALAAGMPASLYDPLNVHTGFEDISRITSLIRYNSDDIRIVCRL